MKNSTLIHREKNQEYSKLLGNLERVIFLYIACYCPLVHLCSLLKLELSGVCEAR